MRTVSLSLMVFFKHRNDFAYKPPYNGTFIIGEGEAVKLKEVTRLLHAGNNAAHESGRPWGRGAACISFLTKVIAEAFVSLFSAVRDTIRGLRSKGEELRRRPRMQFPAPDGRGSPNFEDYLRRSMVDPVVLAPFGETEKRYFAVMENVARYLCRVGRSSRTDHFVSVIMTVCHEGEPLRPAIDAVLGQTYGNFELIVVDATGSTKAAGCLASYRDPRVHRIGSEKQSGIAGDRNVGLRAIRGTLIAYLDSRTIWREHFLETMIGAFAQLPGANAAYCAQSLAKDHAASPYAVHFSYFNKSLLNNINYINLPCFVHKASVLAKAGYFDESLSQLADWDFIQRISTAGDVYCVPAVLSQRIGGRNQGRGVCGEDVADELTRLDVKRQARAQRRQEDCPSLRKHVTIVIPSFRATADLKDCITALLACYTSSQISLIIVDNASNPETVAYLRSIQAPEGMVRVIFNDINYGFTYASNQGIALSDEDSDVLLLNNDAIVTPGAIEHLQHTAYSDPEIAMVVPQQILPAGDRTIAKNIPFARYDRECDVNLSSRNIARLPIFHHGRDVEITFAPFFCVYFKRSTLHATGLLDAEFGRHNRSDRIMCDMVRLLHGGKIVYTPESIFYHRHNKAKNEFRSDKSQRETFAILCERNVWEEELRRRLKYRHPFWEGRP